MTGKIYIRIVPLSRSNVVKTKHGKVGQYINWKGFSQKDRIVLGENAPLERRRVVIRTMALNPESVFDIGERDGKYYMPMFTGEVTGWARTVFTDTTDEGLLRGKLEKGPIRVLEDQRKIIQGKASTQILEPRFWNNGTRMKYLWDVEAGKFDDEADDTGDLFMIDVIRAGLNIAAMTPSVKVKKEEDDITAMDYVEGGASGFTAAYFSSTMKFYWHMRGLPSVA